MLFSVNKATQELDAIENKDFAELDILERQDFQEWAIEEPEILGEELLVIQSEYSNFEETNDRLDILALDPQGKLVVVELKRDEADDTTDLQAIKYASYCATLTAEDMQRDYRSFWNDRKEEELTPEDVGEVFADFLDENVGDGAPITDEGWVEFDLDDKPRILLVAGSFGIQITAPVMWMIEEYDMDITCVTVESYEHKEEILLNTRQVIPVQEAEEYMTKRRDKKQEQSDTDRRPPAFDVLFERGVLVEGDVVEFVSSKKPPEDEWNIDLPPEEFWKGEITGQRGQSNNVRWLYDDSVHSFWSLTEKLLNELANDRPQASGYKFWEHPQFDNRTLSELRNDGIEAPDRT